MREEASKWWEQAQKDFESIAAFLSQQAAEKALKTLFICKLKDSPGKTH